MNSGLSVIVPIPVDDTVLFSSTVPEPSITGTNIDPALYNPATTYALNDLVRRPNHRRYRSRVASNLGNTPETSPLQWKDIGAVNRFAMFDNASNTRTYGASPLTVVLRPGFFTSLYLGEINAASITVTVTDSPGGAVIFAETDSLDGSMPGDWWEYWFGGFKPLSDYLVEGIEPYYNCEVTITLTGGPEVSIGILAIGDAKPLGQTQYGAKAIPVDYSYIKTNEFGETEIVKRHAAKSMALTAFLEQAEADLALQAVTDVLGTPCVWIGSGVAGYGGLRVFGLGSGELSYEGPSHALLTVNVKGLTASI